MATYNPYRSAQISPTIYGDINEDEVLLNDLLAQTTKEQITPYQQDEWSKPVPPRPTTTRGIPVEDPHISTAVPYKKVDAAGDIRRRSVAPDKILANLLADFQSQRGTRASMGTMPVAQQRLGGGSGGGSEAMMADPMAANALIEQNLNPFLTQNVHSFYGGGKMHNPYDYAHGGAYSQRPMSYTDQANQVIALNQLAKPGNKMMANKGMKYKKRYTQGGRF